MLSSRKILQHKGRRFNSNQIKKSESSVRISNLLGALKQNPKNDQNNLLNNNNQPKGSFNNNLLRNNSNNNSNVNNNSSRPGGVNNTHNNVQQQQQQKGPPPTPFSITNNNSKVSVQPGKSNSETALKLSSILSKLTKLSAQSNVQNMPSKIQTKQPTKLAELILKKAVHPSSNPENVNTKPPVTEFTKLLSKLGDIGTTTGSNSINRSVVEGNKPHYEKIVNRVSKSGPVNFSESDGYGKMSKNFIPLKVVNSTDQIPFNRQETVFADEDEDDKRQRLLLERKQLHDKERMEADARKKQNLGGKEEELGNNYEAGYFDVKEFSSSKPKKISLKVDIYENMSLEALARSNSISVSKIQEILMNELNELIADSEDLIPLNLSTKLTSLLGNTPNLIHMYSDLFPAERPKDLSVFARRIPVISIMGHVDHGKTTLLDALRSTNVVDGEAGGITQGLSAFSVDVQGGKQITFIDTPGHAAFTSMRERGAKSTDMVVLVVAADDGIKPQTIESIKIINEAKVPLIVAVTKIDKVDDPAFSVKRIEKQLSAHNILTESLGGEVLCVPLSAKTREGLDELLETIDLQAEVMEDMFANQKTYGEAVVLESCVVQGVGNAADVIVQWGSLKINDHLVIGNEYGKIKAMMLDDGSRVDEAFPGMSVRVVGLRGAVEAGELLLCTPNAERALEVSNYRKQKEKEEYLATLDKERKTVIEKEDELFKELKSSKEYLEAFGLQKGLSKSEIEKEVTAAAALIQEKHKKDTVEGPVNVPIVIKSNTFGSIDAVKKLLSQIPSDEVVGNVVNTGVGDFILTDIDKLLQPGKNGALLLGFNVKAPPKEIVNLAQEHNIDIFTADIIYKLGDHLIDALSKRLQPEIKIEIVAEAEVKALFPLRNNKDKKNIYKIAGCTVKEGDVKQGGQFRVMRNGEIVFETKDGASSLKHFKEDVTEIKKGNDCGIGFEKFQDFLVGDSIQMIAQKTTPRKLQWITQYGQTNFKDKFV